MNRRESSLAKLLNKAFHQMQKGEIVEKKVENRILKLSTAWNKKEILKDFYQKVDTYSSYNDEEMAFSLEPYVDKLLDK